LTECTSDFQGHKGFQASEIDLKIRILSILIQSNLDQGNNHYVQSIDVNQNLSKSDFSCWIYLHNRSDQDLKEYSKSECWRWNDANPKNPGVADALM
jgi:hypothetical protein